MLRADIPAVFRSLECFLLDMDGTVYLGDRLIEGTQAFLEALRQSGRKLLFLTNNSSKNAQVYLDKLARMGIACGREELLTSGQAAAETILLENKDARVWVMGNQALKSELCELGLCVVDKDPDLILTAFDTELTYQKLWDCCNYVRQGLPYWATHPDFNCPTETGFMPDLGSMTELIFASTGRRPERVIGKPERDIFLSAQRRTGIPLSQMAMCGDRLYTDILSGQKQGLFSILVLTGETDQAQLANSDIRPDLTVDKLADLVPYMTR